MDSGYETLHSGNGKGEEIANLEISNFQERRLSQLSMNVFVQKDRNEGLAYIRTIISNALAEDDIEETDMEILLENQEFCQTLFHLFDVPTVGFLNLPIWIENMRYWSKVN